MRVHVEKKWYLNLIVILVPQILAIIVAMSLISSINDVGKIIAVTLITLVMFCLPYCGLLFLLRYELSTVSFEDESVKCIFPFSKKIKRTIAYDEISDYGTFNKTTQPFRAKNYIYISRAERAENQKKYGMGTLYALYRNSHDSIVLEYRVEVMELLKNKCPDVEPW